MGGVFENVDCAGEGCLELREIGHLSEKQEVLAALMEGKMGMQKVAPEDFQWQIFQELKELEGPKTKEALEFVRRKHNLVKLEGERERARIIHRLELSGTVDDFSGAFGQFHSSLDSCSPSAAQETDDAMSESSWTALAKEKERDWWSVDLEGEMEKLEVVGLLSGAEGGSVDPVRKMGHWSARMESAKEGSEEPKGAEKEKQEKEMEVDEATPQEASAEVQSPKRKVTRVESEETQDYAWETLAISHEEAEEVGFVPSALGEPRRTIHWCDNRCSEKAIKYWQIASMVTEEGGEARTIKLCYNAKLVLEEKVLDKYNVEESKKWAFKGRGNPLEWTRVRRSKRYKISKW